MGTNQGRMFKVNWMLIRIQIAGKAGLLIDKEKLLVEYASFFGSTRRTGLEILKQLELSGHVLVKDNQIWSRAAWDAEQLLNKAKLNPENKEECQTETTSKEEEKNTSSAKN